MSFERLPYGMPPRLAEDLDHLIGIEIALEQRRMDDLERAQAEAAYRARQAQQQTGGQQQPAAAVQTSTPLFERKNIVDPPNTRSVDSMPVMPEVAYPQEEYPPIIEGRRGSYGKAVAAVVAVGGLVLGGIFMANQENAPKTEAPATDTPHELAYDCRITSAKEINADTAVVTFAKPVNADHYNIEVGAVNDHKEWTNHIIAGQVADSPASFAFTVNGLEDQRLVAKVTDNHGDSTFCDGAFGVSQSPADTWVEQSQAN